MSETPHTPRTDAIRSETMAGRWSLTEKGGLLEYLEVFESELNEARNQLHRICKEGFDMQDTIGLEPADDYILRQIAAMRDAIKDAHDTFISLQEYWNRDQNDVAMANACWHTVNTSAEALARLQPFIKP